ncbi:hypothetical protein CVA01_23350 [Corynebacterium variabile]|uniref:Uncharacterized protein n=1 Tax=Corynebacterium variabile TaxID=1727 RepID=A0A4Y4C1U4_9CORY|nr:hypothetical protein CVA01_23350 [Corynebacterium variabile]
MGAADVSGAAEVDEGTDVSAASSSESLQAARDTASATAGSAVRTRLFMPLLCHVPEPARFSPALLRGDL